jgi:hypothetical protein
MSQRQFRVMVSGGVALVALGVVTLYIAGGWAATGIGTSHSGTTGGVWGAMFVGWGAVLLFVTCVTALTMRLTARGDVAQRRQA